MTQKKNWKIFDIQETTAKFENNGAAQNVVVCFCLPTDTKCTTTVFKAYVPNGFSSPLYNLIPNTLYCGNGDVDTTFIKIKTKPLSLSNFHFNHPNVFSFENPNSNPVIFELSGGTAQGSQSVYPAPTSTTFLSPIVFTPGTSYVFSITCKNDYLSATTPQSITFLYPAPTTFISIQRKPFEITATWQMCQFSAIPKLCLDTFCVTLTSGATSYTFPNLRTAQQYTVNVSCITNSATNYAVTSAPASTTVTTPPQPAILAITTVIYNQIVLQYNTPSNIGSNGLLYKYSINNQPAFPVTSTAIACVPNTKYNITLFTVDAVTREESFSNQIVISPPAPLNSPTLQQIIGDQVTITWPSVTPYGDYPLSYQACITINSIQNCNETSNTWYTFTTLSPNTQFSIVYQIKSTSTLFSTSPTVFGFTAPASPVVTSNQTISSSTIRLFINQPFWKTKLSVVACIFNNARCYSISNIQSNGVIELNGLPISSLLVGNITTYNEVGSASYSIPLDFLYTFSNLPDKIVQKDANETSIQVTWTVPINSIESTLPILNYQISVYWQQSLIFVDNTVSTSITIPSLLPGMSYSFILSINNGAPQNQLYNQTISIGTYPILPTDSSVIYFVNHIQVSWNSSILGMKDSWYRIELLSSNSIRYAIWNANPLLGITSKNVSLFEQGDVICMITAQSPFFNTSTITLTRPVLITDVATTIASKQIIANISTNTPVLMYSALVKRMDGTIAASLMNQVASTIVFTLNYGVKYNLVSVVTAVVNNTVLSSQPFTVSQIIVPSKPLSVLHLNSTSMNQLTVQIQDDPENPIGGMYYYYSVDGEIKMVYSIQVGYKQFTSGILKESSLVRIQSKVVYQDGVETLVPEQQINTYPLAPNTAAVALLQDNSLASISWKSNLNVTYPIAQYRIIQNSNTSIINSNQFDMYTLSPFKLYTVSVYAINSLQMQSAQPLIIHYYTHPANTNITIVSKTADFMSLRWNSPKVPVEFNAILSYEIIISNSQSQQTHYPKELALYVFDLDESTEYSISIETIIQYTPSPIISSSLIGPTILKSGKSEPIREFTLAADFPKDAPTVSVLEVVSFDTVIVAWTPIPQDKTGNARILKYGIHLKQVVESENKEFVDSVVIITTTTVVQSNYMHTFDNLTELTQYSIQLFGENIKGMSPLSEPFVFTTLADPNRVNSTIGTVAGILIPLFLLCCCIIVLLFFIILIIVIVVTLKIKNGRKKAFVYFEYDLTNATNNPLLEMNEIQSSYIIAYSSLDFTNSQVLGSGAQGTVITALYHSTPVAVKCFPKIVFGVESDFADFYNEVRILAKHSNHINIIRFIGISEDNDQSAMCLITELCTGGNLANYAEKIHSNHNSIDWNTIITILQGIASGMSFLHGRQVAHRDLKCENVLLDSNLTPKIIDFGFTKQMEQAGGKQVENMTMNVGTAAYLAPEAIAKMNAFDNSVFSPESPTTTPFIPDIAFETTLKRKSVSMNFGDETSKKLAYDKKCDVYSFAMIMFVILTGNKLPFGRANDIQILHQMHLNPNIRPLIPTPTLEMIKKEGLEWYIDLMKQCWQTNPVNRPNFTEIIKSLSIKSRNRQNSKKL